MSYHIHPVTGTPALCRAEKGHCPFGARQEHYESKDEARGAFEEQMKDELLFTHKYDPQTSSAVRELFQYHIERSDDPDVKNLLARTQEELATATSVVKLNRISALFLSAAIDLDEDENLAEASDMVGVVAEELKDYYRGFRPSVVKKTLLEDEEGYVAPRRMALKERLEKEKQRDLNQILLDSEHASGLINTEGYQIAIVRNKSGEETLGEFIRNVPSDSIYYGKVQNAKSTEAKALVEKNAQELIQSFSENGVFRAPQRHDHAVETLPTGFRFLSGGDESNVYIHEETDTVYKIPHSAAVTRDLDVEGSPENYERDSLNAVVFNAQAAYAKIDREKLSKDFGAEYLTTYFLSLKDNSGKPVGVIVQPYLDDERYAEYKPTSEERWDTSESGVNDVHSGNVRLDRKTGNLVLFDCLFSLKD